MYKQQLKFQKIVCMICIIAVALAFVYSLGIMTDLYDALYYTMRNPEKPDNTRVPGSRIFYDMQEFNRQYVSMNVIVLLVAVLLFITNTHVRRRYYIGNYVAVAAYTGAVLYSNYWAHYLISYFTVQFNTTVDFEALKEFSENRGTLYLGQGDTFMLDLHYAVAAVGILAVVLLIANLIWKLLLMRGEKKLLEAGKEAAV